MSIDKYYVSLLTVSDYMEASLDENCNVTNSKSCMNYNFLSTIGSTYTITADKDSSVSVYYFNSKGVKFKDNFDSQELHVVLNISTKAVYAGGNGTLSNPYTIK